MLNGFKIITRNECDSGKATETEKELLPMQPGDVENTYADISRLEVDIDYRPDTPIEVGVERFVVWFTDYYGVRHP